MSKRLSSLLFTLYVLTLLFTQAAHAVPQTRKFTRPTVVAAELDKSPFYHTKMAFEDKDYFFAFRHYGKAEFTPGFFVYGKKQNKWVEVKKLSTEHAKLGYYFPFIDDGESDKNNGVRKLVRNPNLPLLAITWDYRPLKNVEYADLPLNASGSISFPDNITYDKTMKAYRFDFGARYNIEEMQTQFWVLKSDLKRILR